MQNDEAGRSLGSRRTPEAFRPDARDASLLAAIVLLTLWVYAAVGGHGFLRYDDDLYVTANEWVRDGLSLRGWLWSWTTNQASNWHPVTWWSHMLDVEIFGLRPAGPHWVNVLLHCATTVLLYGFFRRTTGARWRSGLVAAVFAVHPLHVQSVAWVAERKDVLSTFFWALTLLAYVNYVGPPADRAARRGVRRYVAVLMAYTLALLSKPMVVTLPFLLLLLDRWPLARTEPFRLRVTEKVPLFLLSLGSAVVTYLVQSAAGAVSDLPFGVRAANAIASYGRYVGKTFWPDGLAVYYPYPQGTPWGPVAAGAILLLAMSALAWRAWPRRAWVPVGWFWYLGTLVPVIGLVQAGEQSMADRYTYVPMIGIIILVAWGLAWLVEGSGEMHSTDRPRRRVASVTVGAILATFVVSLAFAARTEVRYWESDETLFTRAIEVTRDNHLAHGMLGVVRAEAGDLSAGLLHEQEAVRIRPGWYLGQKNLGKVLLMMGRAPEAEATYREALRLVPSAVAHVDLASALLAQRKVGPAIAAYLQAVELDPDYAEAHASLATAYTMSGQFDLAFQGYERALEIDPGFVDAYVNYGITLEHVGRVAEARAAFQAALERNPGHGLAAGRLAGLGEGVEREAVETPTP